MPALPPPLADFFNRARTTGLCDAGAPGQRMLSADASVACSQSFDYHPLVNVLEAWVLDDMDTSNHHLFVAAGPLAGAVFFLTHDGASRVVYDSLAAFEHEALQARAAGALLEARHPPLTPLAADQAGLAAWLQTLLDADDNVDATIPALLPSLALHDTPLLRAIALHEDFYLGEALALQLRARPAPELADLARLCAQHPHPQVSAPGKQAVARIAKLAR